MGDEWVLRRYQTVITKQLQLSQWIHYILDPILKQISVRTTVSHTEPAPIQETVRSFLELPYLANPKNDTGLFLFCFLLVHNSKSVKTDVQNVYLRVQNQSIRDA